MKFNWNLIFKTSLIFILLFFIIASASKAWKDYQIKEDSKRQEAMYTQILDGVTAKPITLNVDYAKKTSDGSPLIFGGAGTPQIEEQDAWNKLQDVGVTMVRTDLAMNYMIRNSTVDAYKNNVNDIQNVNNWNIQDLKKINTKLSEAKKRGMKTIGIIDYSPPWLSYDGTDFGVPLDWNVFKDIVKNTYKYHRNELDYVEIWNEANHSHFLTLTNSGMTKPEAYQKIFYYAASAIREVDAEANDGKITPIGGSVDPDPNDTSLLNAVLSNKETKKLLNFVSYHNYYSNEPSWDKYKKLLSNYNISNTPIFITEWNIDGKNEVDDPNKTSNPAIIYTANKLVDFFRMGLNAANYYSIQRISDKTAYLGFYRWISGQAELLPQAKTWRLMSKQMMLGKGPSNIYDLSSSDADINAVGFKNSAGQFGAVLVNNASESKLTTIHFKNFNLANYAKVAIFNASADNDATKPVYTGEIKVKDHNADLVVYLPKEAVIGLTFSEDKNWYDFLNLPY